MILYVHPLSAYERALSIARCIFASGPDRYAQMRFGARRCYIIDDGVEVGWWGGGWSFQRMSSFDDFQRDGFFAMLFFVRAISEGNGWCVWMFG